MNVSVTPRLATFVQQMVATGRYHSVSEVFRDALRLLEQSERRRFLEEWLVEGLKPDNRARFQPDLMPIARRRLQARIQEGLDALDRERPAKPDEFSARWQARVDAAASRAVPVKPKPKRRRK